MIIIISYFMQAIAHDVIETRFVLLDCAANASIALGTNQHVHIDRILYKGRDVHWSSDVCVKAKLTKHIL